MPLLGSGPGRGRSPVEWGDFPSVRPSVRPSFRPSEGQTEGSEGQLEGAEGGTNERTNGQTNGRTNGLTDGRTENFPILQDFVPYRGRCPKSRIPIQNSSE